MSFVWYELWFVLFLKRVIDMTCLTEAEEREKQHAEALKKQSGRTRQMQCYLVHLRVFKKTLQKHCIAQKWYKMKTWHDFIYIQVADGSCRRCMEMSESFQASLSVSLHAQPGREREPGNMFSTTVQEADQHHLMPCQVHFCVSDASFISCKTLHVKFWIILMLYSQTMSCILVLLNVSKAEEKERRLASTIESMQASHMLQNTTLRSRFGQSVSVTKKSETIAYFCNPSP